MKVIIKTLKNQQLPMEVEESTKLCELKQMIEKEHTFPAEQQTLICSGTKLVDEQKTMADYNVKEGNFIIIMIAKAKPVPAAKKPEEEAKKEEAKPVISPGVNIQPGAQPATVTPVVQQQPAQPQPVAQPQPSAAPVDEEKVSNLMAFTGASRDKVIAALDAANGNPDLAFEFVNTGIPQRRPQAQPGMGGAGAGGQGANPLTAFIQSPQFAQIRQRLLSDPAFYQEFMATMQQQQPQMYQMIQANPMAFMQMLIHGGQAMPQGGAGGQPAGGQGQRPPGQNQQAIQVTAEEMAAIDRLVELGFNKQRAIRAFITCDRNEEMAANFLFEQAGEDEDDALNQAIMASAQQQQNQPAQQQPAQAQPEQPSANQEPAAQEQQQQQQPPAQQEQQQEQAKPEDQQQPANNNDKPDDNMDNEDKSAFE